MTDKKQKVLLLEDDVNIRNAIKLYLEKKNYEVLGFEDGHEALDILGEYHPAIILVDIQMPLMNGMTFIMEMKNRGVCQDIPIILVTGIEDMSDNIEIYNRTIKVIRKPFSLADLYSAVQQSLAK